MARYSAGMLPMTARVKRVLFACCWLLGGFWLATGGAAAQPDDRQLVKAVWDATAESNCKMSIDGEPLRPCLAGSVVNERMMTKSEAVAAGYLFVVPTGDTARDTAALNRLRLQVHGQGRGADGQAQPARQDVAQDMGQDTTLSAMAVCSYNSAYLQYTATGYPGSWDPEIGVDIRFQKAGFYCDAITVTYSNTYYVSGPRDKSWYDRTSFGGDDDDPGCWYGLPHGATKHLYGHSGDTFYDRVEHDCGWDADRSQGSITLH